MKGRLLVCVAAATVCALGAVGIDLAAAAGDSASPAQPPGAGRSELATAPDAAASAAFGILRRPRTNADGISSRAIGGLSSASGANIALSRRAYGFSNGEAWVIPGVGTECLWVESATAKNGGAVCDGDESAKSGGLVLEAESPSAPGRVLVAGLVPDGVSSVTVALADGGEQVLPVRENVYMQEVSPAPRSVTVGPSEVIPAELPAR